MAYVDFPYPVRDVRGTVAFDDEGIDLIGLHGFGSGGSLLKADGRIIGYDEDAGVDIVIHGQGVPTDLTEVANLRFLFSAYYFF